MKSFVVHDLVRLTVVAVGVVSLLLFLLAIASLLWDRWYHSRTEVVVEERIVTAYGKTNLRASVSYQHPNGARYGVVLPPGFKVGDTVRVIYDPKYPKSAVVETFGRTWGLALFFAVIGTALTTVGLTLGSRSKTEIGESHA